MTTADRRSQTVVVPIDLGLTTKYNRDIFPLSSYKGKDVLCKGDIFLDATLDEMLKIVAMSDAPGFDDRLLTDTKAKYDRLMSQKERLDQTLRFKTFNPFKLFSNYRAARIIRAASKTLYRQTRTKSEEMRRALNRGLLSVSGMDLQPVDDDILEGASISGIAVPVEGPLDEDKMATIRAATNKIVSLLDSCSFTENPFLDPVDSGGSLSFVDSASDCNQHVAVAQPSSGESDSLHPADAPGESSSDVGTNRLSIASSISRASSPTSQTSSPTVQNIYYFTNSVYSPNSTVQGATLHSGGSQNTGAVIQTLPPVQPELN